MTEEIAAFGRTIRAPGSAADAAPRVRPLTTLIEQLTAGMDDNTDGRDGREEGRGG